MSSIFLVKTSLAIFPRKEVFNNNTTKNDARDVKRENGRVCTPIESKNNCVVKELMRFIIFMCFEMYFGKGGGCSLFFSLLLWNGFD